MSVADTEPTMLAGDFNDDRIRADLPEARPIIDAIDALCAVGQKRHDEMQSGSDLKALIHPFDMLTGDEKAELHALQLRLRPKSRDEARANLLAKRLERRQIA